MKLDEFETEELIQLIENFNHYSLIIKCNIIFSELKVEDIKSELLKRGIKKKDNHYTAKIEHIHFFENNTIIKKESYNEKILESSSEYNLLRNQKSKKAKAEPTSTKLNFDQKRFSLYQVEGHSLNDLKINNGDLILIKNTPSKVKTKLKKLREKYDLNNNSDLFSEWLEVLEVFKSKLIVFKLNEKLFVKELNIINNKIYLMSKNNKYFNYNLSLNTNFELLGNVTNIIRNLD